jgi:MFS family permease
MDSRWLLLVRFLQGAGAAALSAVSLAMVGVYFADQRGRAFGVYNSLKGAGYVVSPLVGGLIVARRSFSGVFVVSAAVGVLALFLSLALPATPKAATEAGVDDDDDFSLQTFLSVFREPQLLPWYAATVVNMFYLGILFGFLPVRAHALGFTPTHSGLLMSAVSLAYLLVQPLAGAWADRSSPGTHDPDRIAALGSRRNGGAIRARPRAGGDRAARWPVGRHRLDQHRHVDQHARTARDGWDPRWERPARSRSSATWSDRFSSGTYRRHSASPWDSWPAAWWVCAFWPSSRNQAAASCCIALTVARVF